MVIKKEYVLKHATINVYERCSALIKEHDEIFEDDNSSYYHNLHIHIFENGMLYYEGTYEQYRYLSIDKKFVKKYSILVDDDRYTFDPDKYDGIELETVDWKPFGLFSSKRKIKVLKTPGYYKVKGKPRYDYGCFNNWQLELRK